MDEITDRQSTGIIISLVRNEYPRKDYSDAQIQENFNAVFKVLGTESFNIDSDAGAARLRKEIQGKYSESPSSDDKVKKFMEAVATETGNTAVYDGYSKLMTHAHNVRLIEGRMEALKNADPTSYKELTKKTTTPGVYMDNLSQAMSESIALLGLGTDISVDTLIASKPAKYFD